MGSMSTYTLIQVGKIQQRNVTLRAEGKQRTGDTRRPDARKGRKEEQDRYTEHKRHITQEEESGAYGRKHVTLDNKNRGTRELWRRKIKGTVRTDQICKTTGRCKTREEIKRKRKDTKDPRHEK